LQKSTSGAWSRSRGHGSSPLARTLTRASAEGEAAPEAGSRWRKPRAREQRYRWRAPRDPTRAARKRGTRSGEGALGDGRRPGSAQAAVFDETTGEADLVTRGDGDAAALAREGSGSAEGRDRGRQRLCRKLGARSKTPQPGGAARRSRRSGAPPGSRCTFHVGVWGFGSRTRLRAALG